MQVYCAPSQNHCIMSYILLRVSNKSVNKNEGMHMFSNGYELDQKVSSFMAGVYGWMSCALAITAGVAYYVASTPAIFMYIHAHPGIMIGLLIVQFGLVIGIASFLNRMTFVTALVLFLVYSATLGITLST